MDNLHINSEAGRMGGISRILKKKKHPTHPKTWSVRFKAHVSTISF